MDVDIFLDRFLGPSSGCSPQDPKSRFLHWIDVAKHPEQFTQDHSPYALAAVRKNARQCLKRLALRNPEIAAQLLQEVK